MHGLFLDGFVRIQFIDFRGILCGNDFDERSPLAISIFITCLGDAICAFGGSSWPDDAVQLDIAVHGTLRIGEEASFGPLLRQTDADIPIGGVIAAVFINGTQLNLQIILDDSDNAEQTDEIRPQRGVFHHLASLEFLLVGETAILIFFNIQETIVIEILSCVKRVLRIEETILAFDKIWNTIAVFIFFFALAES